MKKVFLFGIITIFVMNHAFLDKSIVLLPGVNMQNGILLFCTLFLLVTEFATGRFRKNQIPALLICGFVILWGCASFVYGRLSGVIVAPHLLDHMRDFKSQLIEPIVFFILSFLLTDSEMDSRANLIVIISVFSIINFLSLTNLFGVSGGYDIQESNRFRTILGNPNKVAYYFCLILPIIYHFANYYRRTIVKGFFIALIISSSVFILLSGSRGGFLCLATILLYVLLASRNYVVLVILILASPIVLWILSGNEYLWITFERLDPLVSGDMEEASHGRFAIWRALMEVYTADFKTILYGVGASLVTSVGLKAAPHNMYLKVLIEYGLTGFCIFCLFLIRIFRFIIYRGRSDGADLMPIMLLSSLVVCIAWCFTSLVGMMDMFSFTYGSALAYYLHYRIPHHESVSNEPFFNPNQSKLLHNIK